MTYEDFYLCNRALCEHIASYGYVVVSIGWYVNKDYESPKYEKFIIDGLLKWIAEGGFGLSSILNDQLILLGHSNGGKFIGAIASMAGSGLNGKELSAAILLSSVPYDDGMGSERFRYAKAFLAIHTRTDTDLGTSGNVPGVTALSHPLIERRGSWRERHAA